MSITIKHRWTEAVIFHSETATTMAEAFKEARAAGLANFAGANFARANFARADFAGANFAGANFARANFADAYFADANFADAYFADAYFADANFARAYFADAYFARAYFARADFADADFADAKSLPAAAVAAAEKQAKAPPLDVPVIPKINQTLLEAITRQGCKLDMSQWHGCETTHCRAGWIVTLAGEKGAALEKQLGPARAATLIYRASDPGCRVPHWYATDERALADIKKCAEREAAAISGGPT